MGYRGKHAARTSPWMSSNGLLILSAILQEHTHSSKLLGKQARRLTHFAANALTLQAAISISLCAIQLFGNSCNTKSH
jgi:hypothetical protein